MRYIGCIAFFVSLCGVSVASLTREVGDLGERMARVSLNDLRSVGEYIMGVAEEEIDPVETPPTWAKIPTQAHEDIPGLNEDYLLDACTKMYTAFFAAHRFRDAATALFIGSQIAESKDGEFYQLLGNLGIEGENPSLPKILASVKAAADGA